MNLLIIAIILLVGQTKQVTDEERKIKTRNLKVPTNKRVLVSTRIIGGNITTPEKEPYMVGLLVTVGRDFYFCGGCLVSHRHVVTAAHCFENATKVEVILGASSVLKHERGQIRQKTTNFVQHELWDAKNIKNDIAIVYINYVNFTSKIRPLRLPTMADDDFLGTAFVSGWGTTRDNSYSLSSNLRTVDISVVEDYVCAKRFPKFDVETNLCTCGMRGKSACEGYSGSPLVIQRGAPIFQTPVLIGIVSFAYQVCEAGYPAVYAKVTAYINWLKKMMAK